MICGGFPTAVEGIIGEYEVRRGMNIKMHMKPIYKNHPEWLRPDWGQMVVDAMKFCLVTKYEHAQSSGMNLNEARGFSLLKTKQTETLAGTGTLTLGAQTWLATSTWDQAY